MPSAEHTKHTSSALSLIEASRAVDHHHHTPLDETDVHLLELLCDDGRLSNRSLARKVGLTEATVSQRVRDLLGKRILHIGAIFNWVAAGYNAELHVIVSVAGRAVKEVGRTVAGLDGVISVMEILGQFDLVLRVILPDLSYVTEFRAQLFAVSGVDAADLVVVNRNSKYVTQLATRSAVDHPAPPPHFPNPVIPLDSLDHALSSELLHDGRRSNRELARRLHVNEATVRTRIRKMQEADLLRIRGQVDADKAGLIAAWAIVYVSTIGRSSEEVGAKVATMPEIITLSHVTGRHGIFLFTTTPSRKHLVRLVTESIRGLPGVRSTETHEVIRTIDLAFHWIPFMDG
jgi:Lrp/AsnC family transcriptional regulator for asnA, asnC and gidA